MKFEELPHNPESPKSTEYQFSPEEVGEIEAALKIIEAGYGIIDEEIKKRCDAEQKILSYGSKILPLLSRHFSGSHNRFYTYTKFVDALSQEENNGLLLENSGQESVLTISDGSSASNLTRSIVRIIVDIRLQNPADPRLFETSRALLNMLKIPNLNHRSVKSGILVALSVTGTDEAKEYIQANANTDSQDNHYSDYLSNPTELRNLYLGREHFDSWEYIQRIRERNSTESDQYSGYNYHPGDLDDLYDDDYLDNSPGYGIYTHREIGPEVESVIDKANQLIESANLEETSVPAIKLHMFNYLKAKPDATEEEKQKELSRIGRISKIEKESSDEKNLLPTIGIEIEIPDSDINDETKAILDRLEIPNYPEFDSSLEVNPSFSYNALTQARIIQELTRMGAIKLTQDQEGLSKVPQEDMLSMHVNFGLPTEIKGDLHFYDDQIYRLNDLITAAFSSPKRIQGRKTSTSVTWNKRAQETKKHRKSGGQPRTLFKDYARLELRATEFKDYPSYRMLIEAQRLVAMLISHIKTIELTSTSEKEKSLSVLWSKFYTETSDYLMKIGFTINLADYDGFKLSRLMKDTDLKAECRSIISKYSRQIAAILNKDEVDNRD